MAVPGSIRSQAINSFEEKKNGYEEAPLSQLHR
jgi:hypothetical protein